MSNCIDPRVEKRRNTSASPWTYSLLDQRQNEIAARVREGGRGALLLSELSPVITHGRRTPGSDLLGTSADLAREGIELRPVNRGGFATYHGPGQWVLFPVENLATLTGDSRGVRRCVDGLLQVALNVARRYHPQAEIRSGSELGVWTPTGKIAAVGIQIQDSVLLHGLALNVYRTPQSFRGLRPCGLDAPVDFLLSTCSEEEFEAVGDQLIAEALRIFWP